MSDYLDPNNAELLKDFFNEAHMQVELIEQNILGLEDNPNDQAAIDEIFRAAHTLKGGSATVQMNELSTFTHKLEDLLDEIRNGHVTSGEEHINVLLSSVDVIKAMIAARIDGEIYSEDYSVVMANLDLLAAQQIPPAPTPPPPGKSGGTSAPGELSEYEKLEMLETAEDGEKVLRIRVFFDESNPMNTVGGIQVFAKIKELGQILKTTPDFDSLYEDIYHPVVDYFVSTKLDEETLEQSAHISEVTSQVLVGNIEDEIQEDEPVLPEAEDDIEESEISPITEAKDETREDKPPSKTTPSPKMGKEAGGGSILRVNSQRIDSLFNLVSEAVIIKAAINQVSGRFQELLNDLSTMDTTHSAGQSGQLSRLLSDWQIQIESGMSSEHIRGDIESIFQELVVTSRNLKSQLRNVVEGFRSTAANLGRNTSDLHEAILRIRMVPIRQIFSRFPRLVRDLSKSLDKRIDLEIEGENTELDKSVTEELLDPLMHCVRNSLDHGIEPANLRKESGKPERGHLLLKASNEGNMIVIEISDDGAGIDVDKVRQKAIDKGVIHPNKILSEVEAFDLIFDPGFSTAAEITSISGRGVGLDVVRKQIEKLNGSVTVKSKLGEGTRFTIKLPLTLAIIQGLLIRVGAEIYAIPITSIQESHRIKMTDIDMLDNNEVINIRDDVTSLLRLDQLFRIQSEGESEYGYVVVVGSGENKVGLMVDALLGEEDVVIKPLKDRYTNSPGIAGATILGDGTVALIIDVSQLLELSIHNEQEARRNRAIG